MGLASLSSDGPSIPPGALETENGPGPLAPLKGKPEYFQELEFIFRSCWDVQRQKASLKAVNVKTQGGGPTSKIPNPGNSLVI